MSADYSVSCTSEKYQFGYIWAIVMVFVYPIGCPLYYFYLLYDIRHEIRSRFDLPIDADLSDSNDLTDELRLRREKLSSLRFLYESYRPYYWWWELVETFQRLLLTGILVIIGQGSAIQILVGSLISLFYIYIFRKYEPYNDTLIFSIKIITFWQIFFVFWIALLIKADFPSISYTNLGVWLIFVIFSNLLTDLWKITQLTLYRWFDVLTNRNRTQSTLRDSSFVGLDDLRNISVISQTEMGRMISQEKNGIRSISKYSVESSPLHPKISSPLTTAAPESTLELSTPSSPSPLQPSKLNEINQNKNQ